ncbi:hypothetical protein [Parapedobacter tibetensis]|uniref:hypothetical protein n=1 Tax=Parapedobacter tibetensis TaxID=2972951 RepID=UPI00214D19FD|nr:hypothetical protein [Parapedobacter tibetensis]
MSHSSLYNPFDKFRFDNQTCFLSGQPLQSADEQIQVFPHWLMRKYDLEDKPFKLLDESLSTYKRLKLPCATATAEKLDQLDKRVAEAFDLGHEAVSKLDDITLFQWIGRVLYGLIFNEIQIGIRQQALTGESMNFSQVLAQKFKNLHVMLQSLIQAMQFDGALPFTIVVTKVADAEDTFNYRDEINTMVFSLRMKDFGIIACLQDNGTNSIYHEEYLEEIKRQTLHPIQFEELCGRFFYSAYLFNRLPEYTVLEVDDMIYIEPMALTDMSMKPIFDPWQVKTFGQVLENFWKPWGFTLFEIIKDPEQPMSFLLDAEGKFIDGERLELP